MKFNNVYVEQGIRKHPNTLKIIKKIKFSQIIFCDKYSEVFNPKNQNFRIQKLNPDLILCKKNKNFLLSTPKDFTIGYKENYYFSHMLNCIYDCKYCFLQGMFNSANYVIFVNYEDFFSEIESLINKKKNKQICFFSGYNCDSLALEKITNFLKYSLEYFSKFNNAVLEIRTKNINVNWLTKIKPLKNVIIAFSLNPEELVEKYEKKTPSLKQRLIAIKKVQKIGWKVGLRFDPIINYERNKKIYTKFFNEIFLGINRKNIHSITLGTFRMPKKFFEKMVKIMPNESLEFNHMIETKKSIEKIKNECRKELIKFVNNEVIYYN
tara:strand:- start:296 stop:1264 length:969 start_codon:yes stop_codon:yes gene_type:complete